MQKEKTTCPDCGGENSKNAEKCIYCNYIFKEIEIKSKPQFVEKEQPKNNINQHAKQRRINKKKKLRNNEISKAILLIAGFIGIIAFFLPFFELDFIIFNGELSGFQEIKSIFQALTSEHSDGRQMVKTFSYIIENSDTKTTIGIIISIFILFGPLLYGVFSARMIIRTLFPNTAYEPLDGALVRGIIYIAVAFITLALIGDEVGLDINFFKYVGAGFWLSNVAIVLCFVSVVTHDLS